MRPYSHTVLSSFVDDCNCYAVIFQACDCIVTVAVVCMQFSDWVESSGYQILVK